MSGQETRLPAAYRSGLRLTALIFAALIGSGPLNAQDTFLLTSKRYVGDVANVEVALQVGGDLMLANTGQSIEPTQSIRKLPMSVAAKLVYDERTLALRKDDKQTSRAVRHYQSARALVEVEKGKETPQLRDEHHLITVETLETETTLTCPSQPMTREELDLIDVPANTLLLEELLPTKPIVIGGSWKHSESQLAALLRLDAVSLADVESMLAEVDKPNNAAKISMAGTVHGAVGGVATEIELKAKYTFDLKAQRITLFALLIKEKRSIGHVGPGLDIVAKQVVKIKPIASSEHLDDAALAAANRATSDSVKKLAFESSLNRFRLTHDARWFITSDEKKLTVFRYVDRGEFVAQCNVVAFDPTPAGETSQLADFQRDIEKSLDKKFGQFVSAKEETDRSGRRVFRVAATGKVSDLPVEWVYYLFTTREGRRLSVAFTMEQSLVERFGQADRQFIETLEILAPQTAATGTPTAAKR